MGAFGTLVYVSFIAWFLSKAQSIFGDEKTFLTPIFMLLLLIVSASFTGAMVLGRPLQLYFDGKKKEALVFFFATLGWLVAFIVVVAVALLRR